MRSSVELFTGRAEAYARYRQRYPGEIIRARLEQWCGWQSSWRIADVGAGTGISAEVFLEGGNVVDAVEPNADMRTVCRQLAVEWPRLNVLDGTAESTGLSDGSVEMVVAGRALHWFDMGAALCEFARILKPTCWVAVIQSSHAANSYPQAKGFQEILDRFRGAHFHSKTLHPVYAQLQEFFTDFRQEEIAGETRMNFDALLGLAESISGVPVGADPAAPHFKAELRNYFDYWADGGVLPIGTAITLSAGRLPKTSVGV